MGRCASSSSTSALPFSLNHSQCTVQWVCRATYSLLAKCVRQCSPRISQRAMTQLHNALTHALAREQAEAFPFDCLPAREQDAVVKRQTMHNAGEETNLEGWECCVTAVHQTSICADQESAEALLFVCLPDGWMQW